MTDSRALFIGRFQPFHKGHLAMAKRILAKHDELIIGIGSAQYSHTGENPFTAAERFEMIHRALDEEGIRRYHIIPIPDTHVHSVWVGHVLSLVPKFDAVYTNSPLVIRLFKERGIPVVSLPLVDGEGLTGTGVRKRRYRAGAWGRLGPRPLRGYVK